MNVPDAPRQTMVWVAVASLAGPSGGGYAAAAGRSSIWTRHGLLLALAGRRWGAVVYQATLS